MITERKIKNDQIEDIFPLAPMQEGLLYESLIHRDRDDHPYVIQSRYDISSHLQVEHFKNSWQKIVERHQLLRTAFVYENVKKPVQVVLRSRPIPFKLIGKGELRDQTKDQIAIRDLKKGFDLQKDPLMRITLIRMDDGNYHMIWTHHHIIMDGWSLSIIERELFEIYNAAIKNRPNSLPPAVPIRNYIHWLQSKEQNESVNFWSDLLQDFGKTTPITIRKVTGLKGERTTLTKNFTLPDNLRGKLHDLARNSGVTLSTLMQTVWGILLSYYNHSDDVLFGSVVSGRPPHLSGSQEMVGIFINVIPVRLHLSPDKSLKKLISEVQSLFIDSQDYHDAPLAEVMSRIDRRELFDHLVTFENHPANTDGNADEMGISIQPYEAHDITHYPFGLKITDLKKIHLQYSWRADLFHEERIDSIHSHYKSLLQNVVKNPDQQIRSISPLTDDEQTGILQLPAEPDLSIGGTHSTDLLSDFEREQLLKWNATEKEFPGHSTLVDLFESRVSTSPESTALLCEDTGSDGQTLSMSYRELNSRANRLAHYLMKHHSVTPETIVGICIERTPSMVVGLLGILKAGGAYLPLDPQYPADRLAYMIADSGVDVILTQKDILPGLEAVDAVQDDQKDKPMATVCLDSPELFDDYSEDNPVRQASPDELAYVIYTSGSTGKPKGVMIEHRGVLNWLLAYMDAMQITGESRSLQVASLSFDASVHEIFSTLLAGAELFLIPKKALINRHLSEFMNNHKITHVFIPPSLLAAVPEYPLPHLKAITVGGETCPATLVDTWGKNRLFINGYGPTEITVCATLGICTPGSGKPTIGKPVQNVQVHILDANNRLQPVGVPGELCIAGAGLARGYLNREELTREKFIEAEIFGRRIRLYRSGDLARWLDDGTIDFMGRIDDQVKLRGFRIEPGEIASAIMQHPDVIDAVVMVRNKDRDPYLAAYLTVNTNMLAADTSAEPVFSGRDENVTIIHSPHAEQLLKEVQNILIGTLPDYMIPATMSVLNIIPLTVSGKVDYHLLSRLTGSLQPSESEKPKNELEKQLQEIWSEVLNVQIISVHDHFFRIGGHSLKAMQVVNRIGNKLKIKVELSELNQEPTIRGLAERISKKEKGAGTDIPKAADQNEYPLSYAQQRLWLLHNMDAESAYNMPLTYKIGEQIDVSSLKKAFKQLIQRHEILRTAFVLVNGEPRQKIVEVADIEITLKDLTDADTPIMAARLFCEKQALIPFDLSLPPLLRCILIKTDEQEYILQLCIHHIVGDGWSTRVLFNELITLYESYKFGHKNTLAENRVQYRDFTIWQLNKDLSEDRTFWLNYMESASEKVYLPYDRSPLTKRKFIGRYISTTLEKEIFSGLKKISSHRETTPSTVLLSLFSLLLFKLTGQNDFPIAISSAGRNNRDLEQMIGFFVNILPLRVQINDQMDFDELLDTVIQSSEKIYSHQEYPFNKLVEDLNPDRAGFGQPLSNVVFGYQNYADVHLDSDSGAQSSLQEAEGFELQNNTAKFDITLFAFEKGSELQLDIEYDSELFDEKTIQNYLDTLKSFAKMITSEIE